MTINNQKESVFSRLWSFAKGPIIIYILSLAIFSGVMGDRLATHSRDNHYVYLADAMLHGRFHLEGRPPHRNDWAQYNQKWYVSFPPLPAFLMIPGVSIWGLDFNDRIFTVLFAALCPALLFLLLSIMLAKGRFSRNKTDLWLVSILYGFGTVFFFCAVQGSVWFTAHIVGSTMLLLYLIFVLEVKHPILAGIFLGMAFACRPPMLFAFPLFLYEFFRYYGDVEAPSHFKWMLSAFKNAAVKNTTLRFLQFGLATSFVLGLLMLMNYLRFDNPFEFGHGHLKVIQTARIEKWGLFHYHYLAQNLSIVLTSLPWYLHNPPFLKISMHGLALWVTTPLFLFLLWPKKLHKNYIWLGITALCVAAPSLLYQNSGWVQFGYRFSLDFTPLLLLMLILCGRNFKKTFWAGLIFAILVNTFGAITFNRHSQYYAGGKMRHKIHQPN